MVKGSTTVCRFVVVHPNKRNEFPNGYLVTVINIQDESSHHSRDSVACKCRYFMYSTSEVLRAFILVVYRHVKGVPLRNNSG